MASTKIKLDANPEHKGPAGGKHHNETSVEATLYKGSLFSLVKCFSISWLPDKLFSLLFIAELECIDKGREEIVQDEMNSVQ